MDTKVKSTTWYAVCTDTYGENNWANNGGRIVTAEGLEIAHVYSNADAKQHAAHIVHCVNTHEALVEALSKLRLEAMHYRNTGVGVQFLNAALENAGNVVSKARGSEELIPNATKWIDDNGGI